MGQMTEAFKGIQNENCMFPDAKLTNWLLDSNGRIRVIDVGQETNQRSFTFPTTIGLHNGQGDLLAVAKLSRPIEKNDERDITFRVRLDF
jgi:hypothetical protein